MNETKPQERVHHPYSPSTLQTREACPKWQSAGGTSAAAEAGTMQHDAAETGMDDLRLSDARALAVAQCVAFTEDLAKKFPGCTVLKEQYMPMDQLFVQSPDGQEFEGTTAGYSDFSLVTEDGLHGEIVDYKFGQHGVEEASNNLQGIAYALGLKLRFPSLQDCTVTFLLPHRDDMSQHTFDLTDPGALLLRVKTVVHRAIQAARDPDDFSTAVPSVSACSFCGLLGRCPKVAELALKVGRKYRPVEIPDSVTPTALSDPEQVSMGLQVAQVLKTWAEAYRSQATLKSLTDEKFIPKGYKLVPAVRRTVCNARALADTAKAMLPPEQHALVDNLFDIPIGPIEELISAAAPRGSKSDAVEKFGEAILANGAVEEGTPFAYLRMDTNKKSKSNE